MTAIVIISNGMRGEVFVDGQPLPGVVALSLEMRGGELPRVVLTLAATTLRVDATDVKLLHRDVMDQSIRCVHGQKIEEACEKCGTCARTFDVAAGE